MISPWGCTTHNGSGKTQMRTCRLCQSANVRLYLSGKDFQLLKCGNCDIVFTDPFPSRRILELANKKLYGRENSWEEHFSRFPFLFQRAKKTIFEIKKFKKSGRFLDIGCGFGLLLKIAKEEGFEVLGVEKEKKAAEIAAKKWRLPVIQGEFPEIEIRPALFDVITCFDILEHVRDPRQFLSSIYNILKKDGLLVVQSPNIESLMAKSTGAQWNWLLLPSHLWHFSPKTICMVIKRGGFKILKLKTFDDLSEFNFNLIDVLRIKKTNFCSKTAWKVLRIGFFSLAPLSVLWSKFQKGGLIRIYAKKPR